VSLHQLDHMQIMCTALQTDNHASISPLKKHNIHSKLQFKENVQGKTYQAH